MSPRKKIESQDKVAVDITELQAMLSLGKNTAARIGEESGAVIRIGRRKLYSVEKIRAYMNSKTGVTV